MLRLLVIVLVAAVCWYGWGKYQDRVHARPPAEIVMQPLKKLLPAGGGKAATANAGEPAVTFYTCDARTSCSQMRSCEEVTYFLKNCPGLAWEASGESPSCRAQWCKN
jgi:hypothetical protein